MALWRRLGIGLAAVVVALTALTVLTARPGDPALYPPAPGAPSVTVYVAYDGFHSNLIVPTGALRTRAGATAEALSRLPRTPWVAIGWGDFRYYQERGPLSRRWPDFLRALFRPGNRSVLHLAGRWTPTGDPTHPGERRLVLSAAGFERLVARADRSFVLRSGRPVIVAPGHAPDSLFFASNETFSILKVCNHWTGQLLGAAGIPITPVADTLSRGLEADLDMRALARRQPSR